MSQQLRDLFFQTQIPTTSHRCIITNEQVNRILTLDRIGALLNDEVQLDPHLLEHYTLLTSKKGKKILAILVYIGRVGYLLEHFLHRQIRDDRLPLSAPDLPEILANPFIQAQWHFLAPDIERDTFCNWPSDVVLPFELDEPITDAEGSFGLVHKISIIPDFQKLQEVRTDAKVKILFARKEFKAQRSTMTMAAFARERQVLELLNLLHHPHIVPLLASYIHGNKFNLIFPLADGSLESLLSGTGKISAIAHEALWTQVLGITSALDSLHNFTYKKKNLDLEMIGYHHDLKPENILIKDGVFLLADFGLAKLKDPVSQSGTMHKNGALTYGAPETFGSLPKRGRSVGRALDIWSWGCILIEIITLELMTPMGVVQFRQNRTTNSAMRSDAFFHSAGKLKPEVEMWIDMLRDSPATNKYRFKGLVKSTLDLVKTMLVSDPKKRASASSAHLQLSESVKYATACTLLDKTCESGKDSERNDAPPSQPPVDPKIAAQEARENLEEFLGKDHPVMKALALTLRNADG